MTHGCVVDFGRIACLTIGSLAPLAIIGTLGTKLTGAQPAAAGIGASGGMAEAF